jgi:glycosyltransferase involved in cell wall biosynthesis
MKLGLIARADNRGLGQQTWAVYRNLKPAKTLVVDCPSANPLQMRYDRFPDAHIIRGLPNRHDLHLFLDGLTTVYTAETGYGHDLWQMAADRNISTVLHANYEFLDPHDDPTVWAAPSEWHLDLFPPGTIHLRVPIETDRFPITPKPRTASRFLHVVGRPAVFDRNGTLDLLKALRYVTATITVTVTCQQPGYVSGLIAEHNITTPPNVTLVVDSDDHPNYWDLYQNQHVLVLPRRFGGLCLPAQEAIGAQMPVIMPDISPNDAWLCKAWLIEAHHQGDFRAKQHLQYFEVNPADLAARIDQFATDEDFYQHSVYMASNLRNALSWDTLTPNYRALLT